MTHLDDPSWRIADCRYSLSEPSAGRDAYNKAHIPGALYVDLEKDLSMEKTERHGRHPLPEREDFVRKVEQWSIGPDTQVVVYDDANGAFAGRLWWMLRWIGHKNVAVLDGGFPAWEQSGYRTTDVLPGVKPLVHGSYAYQLLDELMVSNNEVLQNMRDKQFTLVDARTAERFSGDEEPIDPVAGHVPGAINLPYVGNLDSDGYFLSAKDLRFRFESVLGSASPDKIVHMCGSGVSACHNILAMDIAGIPAPRLYVGSWSEWVSDSSRPIAKGAI